MIIDDGSNDDTVKIAKENNVNHILSHPINIGLGLAFQSGLNFAKQNNFDYLINLDADNQYNSNDILLSTKPILQCEAETVVVQKHISVMTYVSPLKYLCKA